ncbi:MAG: AzlC family ABC transporter permease [Lachnospiraceae bacterium]|nr:AzlC family ABC transporter permease [Lachnospiraceae bacterium]MBQ9605657.1 AzlC family ABC transporter permease [Lachnospiraceae bacterium]MBR1524107.1 AzlC family ABC transporter permease [Lachnospiraceae bacterium]
MDRKLFAKGLRDGIPISMGYLAVAFTLGIAAGNINMDALQSFFMSLGMVASAGEYAAIILIGSAAGVLEMIATTFIINLRYFLMSCSLSQKLAPDVPMWKRMLLAWFVTDELFGISSAVEGYLDPVYTYGAAVVSIAGWCLGTVLGVIAGDILPVRLASAMNVALYGMFLAIIIPPAKKSSFMAALVLISMVLSYIFSAAPLLSEISEGFRIIILTVVIAGAAAFIRPVKEGV